ncbi:MAG: TonB-dependent receptor, partial [Woeseiaceae bacterium]|nr:TonB-dependent receptor [Woeseiaceae bacterium]
AAYYFMVWDQIQLQFSDPNIFTLGVVNFPEAELQGIEAHFSWLPADGWDISGTLGWNEAEISETAVLFGGTPQEIRVVKETDLPIMPDWKGSLSVEYRFDQPLFGGTPFLRLDHTYNGEATSSLEGIQSIIFINPVRTHESYNITDLRFGIDAENWSAALFIDNVTDERAQQFFNDRWAQTRLSINRPLTFGVNFRRNFD